MPVFNYQIKNKSGKLITGEIKSDNLELLEKNLIKKGYDIVDIKEKNVFNDISQISLFKQKVTTKDLAIFCRQFAIVLAAGIPIAKAIDVIRVQTVNPTLKEAIESMYESIQKGTALSVSMRQFEKIFPQILINMIEAGEVSGQLDLVLSRLSDTFEKEVALVNKIKKATTYPIVVLTVAVGVVLVLMVKVVPSFIEILGTFKVELPMVTKILIKVSDFFKDNIFIILAGMISSVIGFFAFKKSETGKIYIDTLLLKIPVIKTVITNIITARFTRSLGILLSSGVLMIQSMEIVQKIIGNSVVVDKMSEVIGAVKKGKGLAQPIEDINFFSPMVLSMIRIGEESGEMETTLSKCADFYDDEVEVSLDRLTALMEPAIMLVLAFVVVYIVLSIMTPMFSIYQNMG